jgi:putative ABC transport system permease protein
VDGVPVGNLLNSTMAGCAPGPLPGLLPGDASRSVGPARLSVAEDLARQFGLRVGSRVEFAARGRIVPATVAEVRRITPVEAFWFALRMDCGGLDPASLFYHAAVRIRPDRIAAVRRAFIAEYPAIPVFTADDLSEVIGQVSHDAVLLARFVAWYALGSSLAVLMAIVSASRGLRLREIAILSALGARRRTLVRLYTIEFAAIGVLAGAIGSVLAYGFTAVMVSVVFGRVQAPIEWKAAATATVAAAALSVAAGWLPAYGLLRRKPLEVLRGE